jgi:hypothetical protein
MVTFTPNADRVFLFWLCSPASHTASLSDSAVTNVFITGNTTLTALTAAKQQTLEVNWDHTRGQVSVPGGQGGSGYATATVEYGQTISLTATPNSGYYTVWHGNWASGDWSGERYGNSVNVRLTSPRQLTASFRPNSEYPSTMNTVTVTTNGGSAYVSTAGATTASFTGGSYPYSSAQGPSRFSFSVLPQTGYYFSYFTWSQGGQTRYTTNNGFTYYYANTYAAELVTDVKLNLEVEGQGVVTSPNFKYSWNPRPYVPQGLTNPPATAITPSTSANQITMTPSACPGWTFSHWEYKNANGDWIVTSGNPFQNNALTAYMNWWTGTGIHVPDGEDWLDVKAVFTKPSKPQEHGHVVPGHSSAGASYGIVVQFVYENTAGWYVLEEVTHSPEEPAGCANKCYEGSITINSVPTPLNRCNLDGTPNPSGAHGMIYDSIKNNNGPPWILFDVFQMLNPAKDFPCCNTTDQVAYIAPLADCDLSQWYDYPHVQYVSLTKDDAGANSGAMHAWSTDAGDDTVPWARP